MSLNRITKKITCRGGGCDIELETILVASTVSWSGLFGRCATGEVEHAHRSVFALHPNCPFQDPSSKLSVVLGKDKLRQLRHGQI
ncbi:hypothetical protein Psta_0425 [Pirellula staleyi DSM 6068]|uniref:Uncharacterized protein n=1 Tax=Pirellula staleyi (strain ATCC 27377 / DSM 6068 / ICPB 4128) TaxID=530564 RepID=D2R384_PIRSD|nr:hypothetical protein Psta_0425 [Pirellula staleyi DSM 6068]